MHFKPWNRSRFNYYSAERMTLKVPANHLLSASFMSAPAALAVSKLFYPETKKSRTTAEETKHLTKGYVFRHAVCNAFWATVSETIRPVLSDRCPVCHVLSVCDVGVLWPNSWMDQDATCHRGTPWTRLYIVTVLFGWGPRSPPEKRGTARGNFRPMSVVAKRLNRSRCHLVWR